MVGLPINHLTDPTVNGFQIEALFYHLFLSDHTNKHNKR